MRVLSIDEAHDELVKLLAKADGPVKQKFVIHGVDVHIENPKGTHREWYDSKTGESGKNKMHHAYGFIPGAKAADGDSLDVFVGPDRESELVFIVNQRQMKDGRKFDEHKALMGFGSEEDARAAYLMHYNDKGPKLLGSIRVWSIDRFKRWLESGGKKDKPVRKAMP